MDRLKELQAKLEGLKTDASKLETAEEINAKLVEIENVKAKIKVEEMRIEDERAEAEAKIKGGSAQPIRGKEPNTDNEAKYKDAFYNILQGKQVSPEQASLLKSVNNALSSSTGQDGGYLIPADQRTTIKELQRQMKSLEVLVNVEPVTTLSGSRNIEKDAEYTPFVEFNEGDDVPTEASPQFVNIPYTITDKGGILPVPNNLLADNTANLAGYLNAWLAKKQVATRNSLITTLLATKTKTAIANFDDIKKALNVTLDPSIAAMATIVTNQTGYNWLDIQKDGDDKYLMQPMVTDLTKKGLFGLYPVEVFSNKTLANDTTTGTKAPLIIGALKEAVTLFDRQAMSLLSTQIGGTSFTKNRTEIRAITREDVAAVDFNAIVYGQITIA